VIDELKEEYTHDGKNLSRTGT